jgi:hypothetical protein
LSGVVHGVAGYPGVLSVESATYTMSHGISPGTCVLRCQVQTGLVQPAPYGDLVFSDGTRAVVVPDCRLDNLKVDFDDSGYYWSLSIVDRRWKWRDLGAVSGCYNQLDPFGKLIPWTIRSPRELAVLCLSAMGETDYVLNMPEGLNYPGPFTSAPIINVSGVNPPISWQGVAPAQALQQLCDQFGCRVVYQLSSDSILITPQGPGSPLPTNASISKQGPSLKSVETPDGIGVLGAPTRYQLRLQLIAVGKEWDGSYRPINELSYAPLSKGAAQSNSIGVSNPNVAVRWLININGRVLNVPVPDNTVASSLTAIADGINGDRVFKKLVSAAVVGDEVVVTALAVGVAFALSADFAGAAAPEPNIVTVLLAAAVPAVPTWQYSGPPQFANVRATNRLTYTDAVNLARESVFRCYALTNFAGDGSPGIPVPGLGRTLRREQIVLQDTQVQQVVPQPGDATLIDPVTGRPATVNFYNGYSRDVPAAVYGAVAKYLNSTVWYLGRQVNTKPADQVFVPFSVDPLRFMITFAGCVYQFQSGGYFAANLILQTGCQARDPVNNQVLTFVKTIPLGTGAGTNPRMYHHEDVQVGVIGQYDAVDTLIGSQVLETDPLIRADAYLAAHLKEYQVSGGNTVEYNGILPIDLDSGIQQVTWSVGDAGAATTASINTEHDIWVPNYPERRRAEFLPPAAAAPRPQARRVDMPAGEGGVTFG